MLNRRTFVTGSAAGLTTMSLPGCARGDHNRYAAVTALLRAPLGPDPDLQSFVRYATLAPNGHNTQPWRFLSERGGVAILPDLTRRTPIVDPDDHHLFVSLGCATENLMIAAAASGRPGEMTFDQAGDGRINIDLTTGTADQSALCRAIPVRQSTRSIYDGSTVSVDDLRLLERAAAIEGVALMLIVDRPRREVVLEHVLRGNDWQMDDPAFMAELKQWLRFNADAALATRDGLYAVSSGSHTAPTWLGRRMFSLFFNKQSESKRYREHIRSSSGIAVFVGDKADRDHWVRVGRSFQRFALQATVLGLRTAMVNQPVEVVSVRTGFARALGLGDFRPDLVVRFGRAPALPMSLRRDVLLGKSADRPV